MEHRMRDLDMIEERDPDDNGRRLGTIAMATLAFLGVSAAVGVVVGRAARPAEIGEANDPLAALGSTTPLSHPAGSQGMDVGAAPDVAAEHMSFPKTLKGKEDRPEVLAALAAAGVEADALGAEGATSYGEPKSKAGRRNDPSPSDPVAESDPARRVSNTMPAFVSAGAAQRTLAQAAQHDPLVRAAIPAGRVRTDNVPAGEEGEFNLQVISYASEGEAAAFAEGLRTKGHSSFVTVADIPERGRYYRVRIGPFESRWRAERYRKRFEETEQMNTYVVRRPKDD